MRKETWLCVIGFCIGSVLSASWDVDPKVWSCQVDYLYVRPEQQGVSFGMTQTLSEDPLDETQISQQRDLFYHFSYEPGVRVCVGYELGEEQFKLNASWESFKSHAKGAKESVLTDVGEGVRLFPYFANNASLGSLDIGTQSLSASYSSYFNQFDVYASRGWHLLPCLSLDLFLGLRGMVLQQWMYTDFRASGSFFAQEDPNLVVFDTKVRSHFKGLGVVSGFETMWDLYEGVSLYGSMRASLLYAKNESSIELNDRYDEFQNAPAQATFTSNFTDEWDALKGATDLAVGLQYRWFFNCDESLVTVRAGWEHHLWYSQNSFKNGTLPLSANTYSPQYAEGDFTWYGWAFSASVTF